MLVLLCTLLPCLCDVLLLCRLNKQNQTIPPLIYPAQTNFNHHLFRPAACPCMNEKGPHFLISRDLGLDLMGKKDRRKIIKVMTWNRNTVVALQNNQPIFHVMNVVALSYEANLRMTHAEREHKKGASHWLLPYFSICRKSGSLEIRH